MNDVIPIGWYRVTSRSRDLVYRLGHLLDVRPGPVVTSERGTRRWIAAAHLGQVFVWYGPGPPGPLPPFPAAETLPVRRTHSWLVAANLSILDENSCDTAHFPVVHHHSIQTSEMRARVDEHGWLVVTQRLSAYGLGIEHEVTSTLFSPGNVLVRIRFLGVEQLIHVMLTPLDVDHTENFLLVASKRYLGLGHPLNRFFLRRLAGEISRDVPIWENLRWQERPALVEGDGPIALYRKWYRGYLPEAWAPRAVASPALAGVLAG